MMSAMALDERRVPAAASILRIFGAAIALFLIVVAFSQISGFSLPGLQLIDTRYVIFVCGLPFGLIFLYFPRGKKHTRVSVAIDIALAIVSWVCFAIFFMEAEKALAYGYEFGAPKSLAFVALLLCALLMEGARRAAGPAVAIVALIASFYPLFNWVFFPAGMSFDLLSAASYYAFGTEAIFGVPARSFAYTIIGYLMFGVALQHTGAADFFMRVSTSMLGRHRGGASKVSIISSALLGSMSGSVVSNVLTTGAMTIPAMKRSGMKPSFAGAVEACASTGAVLMPPVMGATAFVMASFIGVPYREVVIAAIIPSLLFYGSLFLQMDAYAARNGIKGMSQEDIPPLWEVLKEGWHYIAVFAFLIYLILTLPNESVAPFYAVAFLLVWGQIFQRKLWSRRQWLDFLEDTVKLFAEINGALLGIGILIGAIGMTGMAATITSQLAYLAGDSLLLMLLLAALASFLLGFGMPSTPAYLFVAIIVAPALVRQGIDTMAAHMFLYYWGMISFITPPVAIAAYAASGLAGASPTSVGFQAVRLATIIYFVPFFFVLNPVLILQGEPLEIASALITAGIGVWLLVGATQSYLLGIGDVTAGTLGKFSIPARILMLAGGLCFVAPGAEALSSGLGQLEMTLIALLIAAPAVALTWFHPAASRRRNDAV